VSWLSRRLDHLGSAAAGGVGGLGFSQAPAFTHAYLQRLGGHIDEARRTIDKLAAGDILPWLGGDGREQAVAELTLRLAELERFQQVLLDSPAILRPFTLLRHADWSIARGAAQAFVPSVPIDPASIVWTLIGVILAAIAWDTTKIPFWTARKVRARREAKAGNGDTATLQRSPKPRQKSGKHRRPAGGSSAP